MKETTLFGLRVACLSVIGACLLVEGAILAFTGFPYWVPWHIFIIGCLWVVTCVAAVYTLIGAVYSGTKEQPIFVLLASCLLFAASAVTMWPHSSDEKTLVWFLYQHSLELGVILSSLVLCFIPKKAGPNKMADSPAR